MSSNPNTSRMNNQNLPFYLNDFDEFQKKFVCLRINGILDYANVISADFSHTEQQLIDQFELITNDLQHLSFLFRTFNLIVSNDKKVKSAGVNFKTCAELYESHFGKPFDVNDFKPRHVFTNYIPVDVLKKVTIPTDRKEVYSPLFTNHKGVCRLQNFRIPIDCLVLVDLNTNVNNLHEIIIEKLISHLETIKQCYLSYYQNENDFEAQTYHFLIDNQKSASANLMITCIYPSNQPDDALLNLRRDIHKALDLTTDKPVLRRVDRFQFKESNDTASIQTLTTKYLLNPHESAKPSNVKNGKQILVKGDYLYFHYMQDNFNDNGWGCAYRSFQTIFSWFKLQTFTDKPIPTHREIQQTLVDLGDKPKEFVGSSKWIGSMEISFCLSEMLNVDSKIMSVSKGSELADKARELQYHFETEGTPVMIGGGVLAHTIIGVDFDELTGEVKYLILDPHYTGGEDIKTITSKGWVGWKDMKFWNENAFYNLCCPLRPKGV